MPSTLPNLLDGQKLLLVGCGKMGSALLQGWLNAGLEAAQFYVQEPNPDAALADLGVHLNVDIGALQEAAPSVNILAIKPQLAVDILPSIALLAAPETLVISLMAGVSINTMSDLLGGEAAFVRTMPNTPAAIGAGMTALYASSGTQEDQKAAAEALLAAVGQTVWLDTEKALDAVTAISGSGPAYLFHMVEALAAAGVNLGLQQDMAEQLAMQTIIGSASMLREDEADPRQLRVNVTSPGGTTEAALDVLMGDTGGLVDLMRRATQAAAARAGELAKIGEESPLESDGED
ncbi:MAG: pyrroline-5-carboxylate reductase [Rhodobiaceae bacterium]|nr:pyrroline-5-carboxylate reductase [Rhodobiaceae bacterium]